MILIIDNIFFNSNFCKLLKKIFIFLSHSYDLLQTESSECVDSINTSVFVTSLVIGTVFALVYLTVGSLINVVGKKNILVIFFSLSSIAGLAAQYVHGAGIVQGLIGLVLISSTCIGIINTVVVDIYPTQVRAMALAVSLMCGRFGAVAGSHLAGPLFYHACDQAFLVFTFIHLGNFLSFVNFLI